MQDRAKLELKEIQYMELARGEIGPALPIVQWHSMGSQEVASPDAKFLGMQSYRECAKFERGQNNN